MIWALVGFVLTLGAMITMDLFDRKFKRSHAA